MEIKQGKVKYRNSEQLWTYSITEDGKQYYFLDPAGVQRFKNNTIVVTTNLKEAVDPMYASTSAMNIGLIDENGKEVIPCTNKSIRPVNDSTLLVEPANPISPNVIDAAATRKDFKHVALQAAIRDNFKNKLGDNIRYLFNDQFSEVTICDIDGNNLVNGEYYSFVVLDNDKLFMSKNSSDSGIVEYSLVPTENVVETPQTVEQPIDVNNVNVDNNVVDNALASTPVENVNVGFNTDDVAPVALNDDQMVQPVEEVTETPVEQPAEEVQQEVVETPQEEVAAQPVENVVSEVAPVEDISTDEIQLPKISADNEEELPMDDNNVVEETPVEQPAEEVQQEVVETPVEETAPVEDSEEVETPQDAEEVSSEEINIPTSEDSEEVVEDAEEDIDLNDEQEDTTLDNMFNEVSSARDVEDDMKEEVFSDSVVKTDSIEDDYDDYQEDNYEYTTPAKDTTMEDVAKSMAAVIKFSKELKATNSELTDKLESANNSRNNAIKKNKMLEEKVDILSSKTQSLENKVIKLESRNDVLENRVHDQERIIDSQEREIDMLKSQLAGMDKVVELSKTANELVDGDYVRDIKYYQRIA